MYTAQEMKKRARDKKGEKKSLEKKVKKKLKKVDPEVGYITFSIDGYTNGEIVKVSQMLAKNGYAVTTGWADKVLRHAMTIKW